MSLKRCQWAEADELLLHYHDHEWGVRPTTASKWLEVIVLESFQAGLSWRTVLHKREHFRRAFAEFDVPTVSQMTESDINVLMQDAGLIRNRKKLEAAVANANIVGDLMARHGSIDAVLSPLETRPADLLKYLQSTFRFVGRTTAESIAFASGLLPPPHSPECFMYAPDPAIHS